jgi:hypothetical protein
MEAKMTATIREWEKSEEVWKLIPGYHGYEVSSLGRLKHNGKISSGSKNSKGYLQKTLKSEAGKRTWRIHRLVLLGFVGPSELDVNHKNGIKTDNRLENLEYLTRADNNRHASRTGLNPGNKGTEHGMARLTEAQVYEIRANTKDGHDILAKEYGVSNVVISKVRLRKSWKHLPKQDVEEWKSPVVRLNRRYAPACINGHLWTEENTIWMSNGKKSRRKFCRLCKNQKELNHV